MGIGAPIIEGMKAQDAIDFFGTQEALAEKLGIKQPSIAGWLKSGDVPELRQLQLEVLTNGKLKADSGILPAKKPKRKQAQAV